jgi:hypothetical protein
MVSSQRKFSVEFKTSAVAGAAEELSNLSASELVALNIKAINQVAQRAIDTFKAGMQPVNLAQEYIDSKIKFDPAGESRGADALIWAAKGRTPLGRYDPQLILGDVKNPKRSKGRANWLTPVPKGKKVVGVNVEVLRGSRVLVGQTAKSFVLPLRGGNGWGVFLRTPGSSKYQHLLSLSVDQLLAFQIKDNLDEIGSDLQQTIVQSIEQFMSKLEITNGSL